MSALLIGAHQLISFFQHNGAALFTFFIGRLLPHHEAALRIIDAAIISPSLFSFFKHNILSAFGAGYAYFFIIGLRIAAFGKAGTGQKPSMGAIFNHHLPAADIANLV